MDKAEKIVDTFHTKYEEGFNGEEIIRLLDENSVDKEVFFDKLGVNTGIIKCGCFLTYHCDIELALRCVFEGRNKRLGEWD